MIKTKFINPLKDVYITQPFGVNWVEPNFYKNIGYSKDKHPGKDYRAKVGCKFNIVHDGVVTFAGYGQSGSLNLIVASSITGESFRTVYCHCSKLCVKKGDKVKQGRLGGKTGNTGKYTNAPHLHFEIQEIINNQISDFNNGYRGAVNPEKYFPKDCDKSNAYHRYGRKRSWIAEYKMRFKNAWLHRQLIKRGMNPILSGERINALVYGSWDFESVINPAMEYNYLYLTKKEFEEGKQPFK